MLKIQNDLKFRGGVVQVLGLEVRGLGCFFFLVDLSYFVSYQYYQGIGYMLVQVGYTLVQVGIQRYMLVYISIGQYRMVYIGIGQYIQVYVGIGRVYVGIGGYILVYIGIYQYRRVQVGIRRCLDIQDYCGVNICRVNFWYKELLVFLFLEIQYLVF